jgi:hypothetical protein
MHGKRQDEKYGRLQELHKWKRFWRRDEVVRCVAGAAELRRWLDPSLYLTHLNTSPKVVIKITLDALTKRQAECPQFEKSKCRDTDDRATHTYVSIPVIED